MSKVHLLSPDIISKIAAGEVIERPASVVKELLENSLDAQTQSIDLTLKESGKTMIRIKDSGTGIEKDDMETIFHRHSTSKISTADDLFRIHSLGFRGEALYSVAAIADVILRSRAAGADEGWEIHMRGGEKIDFRPANIPSGTEIEIKELFFNTPARRKFLKSNTTELNQVLNIFIPYGLLNPQVRFSLTHQDKKVVDLEAGESLTARAARALNLDEANLLEIRKDFPERNITLHLILGDINIIRSRRDLQFIFINRRPVQSKAISFHMNDVYRLLLPPGNHPFFAAFIDYPAENIDVNIHPTKREVKIKDEQVLIPILRHLTETVLMNAMGAKQVRDDKPGEQPDAPAAPDIRRALSKVHRPQETFDGTLPTEVFESPAPAYQPTEQYSFPDSKTSSLAAELFSAKKQETLQDKLSRSRYIGSFINKFLLFEFERFLLVVDQHAAQERITFEQLIQQMEKSRVEVQRLLSPYLIKLSPQDLVVWEEARARLDSIGFETTQFDDETVALHSYPVLLKDPARAARDIIAGGNVVRCDHETIARRACRSSIMAGDTLNREQAEFQREQLIKCRDPFTCPHGRPTVIEMTEGFLDKQFLRT